MLKSLLLTILISKTYNAQLSIVFCIIDLFLFGFQNNVLCFLIFLDLFVYVGVPEGTLFRSLFFLYSLLVDLSWSYFFKYYPQLQNLHPQPQPLLWIPDSYPVAYQLCALMPALLRIPGFLDFAYGKSLLQTHYQNDAIPEKHDWGQMEGEARKKREDMSRRYWDMQLVKRHSCSLSLP